eukprot:CAMPEP_0178443922 /NCGR_PEP_ID=MMETSP0689_2-20121128/39187_1 /TAXON_ID=160604 /ORGANISM="Amphidinium massartii, Strain CS-259" /LENGTH=315 /DNA_ID=CAMNT_0020068029 /DNA_START=12 /DNA_END=959 /DNA_ORIENTATION=+
MFAGAIAVLVALLSTHASALVSTPSNSGSLLMLREGDDSDIASLALESEALSSVLLEAAASLPSGTTQDFLQSLEICGACNHFERYGEKHDGGYLMCMDQYSGKHPAVQAAYSMGVEHHDKWSEHVASRLNLPVYQFDCTVKTAPQGCSNCHFFSKCIKSSDGHDDSFPGRSWSMKEVLENTGMADAGNRTLLMKMDIEAAEWAIFESEDPNLLRKFEQIVVEFHRLRDDSRHSQYLRALQTILSAGFKVAHLHGNNYEGMYRVGSYSVPNVLEVTFTSGVARPICMKKQEYKLGLDMINTHGATDAELPMASLP